MRRMAPSRARMAPGHRLRFPYVWPAGSGSGLDSQSSQRKNEAEGFRRDCTNLRIGGNILVRVPRKGMIKVVQIGLDSLLDAFPLLKFAMSTCFKGVVKTQLNYIELELYL